MQSNFVFYHVDADRCFSAPRRTKPENVEFYESILLTVRQHLDALKQKHDDSRPIDDMVCRVLLLLPYYSIEAWLFQNTRVGRELCRKHHRGQHVASFDTWEQDRGVLDEVEKPKEVGCLNAGYYLDLATREYPSRSVYAARKSFAESVDRLSNCDALQSALAAAEFRIPIQ